MVNADFKSHKKAEKVALKYARYMGQLPAFLKGKNLPQPEWLTSSLSLPKVFTE